MQSGGSGEEEVEIRVKEVIKITKPLGQNRSVVNTTEKTIKASPKDTARIKKEKKKLIQRAYEKSDSINKAHYNRY